MEALNQQAMQAAHPGMQHQNHNVPSSQGISRELLTSSTFDLNMAAASNLNAQ